MSLKMWYNIYIYLKTGKPVEEKVYERGKYIF